MALRATDNRQPSPLSRETKVGGGAVGKGWNRAAARGIRLEAMKHFR